MNIKLKQTHVQVDDYSILIFKKHMLLQAKQNEYLWYCGFMKQR